MRSRVKAKDDEDKNGIHRSSPSRQVSLHPSCQDWFFALTDERLQDCGCAVIRSFTSNLGSFRRRVREPTPRGCHVAATQ